MNLGAVDHFFETLASRAQWQGCPTPGADRRPRSPQPPPVAASAKGASSRFLRCGRSRVAQHRRGAERDAGSAEEIEQAAWERSCDRSSTRSEEYTSELPSLMHFSYAVLCMTKNKKNNKKQ